MTKVNRCLTEGRRAMLERLRGIESGGECDRLAPLLSLLADGEAGARELRELRPHLKTCLACRARLREYREAPARVAALLPVAALAGHSHALGLPALAESLLGSVQQKAERLHAALELASGKKVAVVAASAAALAGGGVSVQEIANHPRPRPRTAARSHPKKAVEQPAALAPQPQKPAKEPAPKQEQRSSGTPPSASAPPPAPDPAVEFTPEAASAPTPAPAPEPGPSPSSGSGSGEFGP